MMRAAAEPGEEPSRHELEALWIRQIALGDRQAFESLYRAYQGPLFRYFLRMLGRIETAEELTSDVMVAVWTGAARFRADSKPSTWIFGIAHHKALNAIRGKEPPTVDVAEMPERAATEEGAEARLVRESLRDGVRRALAGLSPEQREVMQLTFFQGLSYPEIAAVVGCPVNTVKTRMFYARRKLQEALGTLALGRATG